MEGGLASAVQVEGLLGGIVTEAVIIQVTKSWLTHTLLQQERIVSFGGPGASSIPTPTLGAVCRPCRSPCSRVQTVVQQGVSLSQVLVRLGDTQVRWTERIGSCAPTTSICPSTALPVWDLTVHQGDVVDDESLSSQLWGTIHSGKFEQGHQRHQILPLEPSGAEHISSGELGTWFLASGSSPRAGAAAASRALQGQRLHAGPPSSPDRLVTPGPPAGAAPMVRSVPPAPLDRALVRSAGPAGPAHCP